MIYFGYPVINPFRSHTPAGFYDPIKGHTGIDVATPMNTGISLAIQTTVVSVKTQPQMGLSLYLRDADGNILVFSHLNSISVVVGAAVPPNTVFAMTGNSGSATTGPHLHFEIIAPAPAPGFEMMSRTLGEFSGFNINPATYMDNLPQHWSDEAMSWMLQHGIISDSKDPNAMVTWGEFAVSSKRLAEKVLDWSRNS
ncbi:M23 family metallopeptidase [Candidatus Peregrinibacteria bacterium]|jgi:murein DD-endopeptidase MepM/ murein hydrolase activator NlpD|nr:M23 family metallopeptidase [Candidatus Peregrinibacteria bacterium]MBT4631451.1 M23 family metallopeptidase [Candidatus Peregrinibacteria bacterium]MBT5823840.1 M23 family metallopeptidase [Candidatus Peregrinibacteria bacterium]